MMELIIVSQLYWYLVHIFSQMITNLLFFYRVKILMILIFFMFIIRDRGCHWSMSVVYVLGKFKLCCYTLCRQFCSFELVCIFHTVSPFKVGYTDWVFIIVRGPIVSYDCFLLLHFKSGGNFSHRQLYHVSIHMIDVMISDTKQNCSSSLRPF